MLCKKDFSSSFARFKSSCIFTFSSAIRKAIKYKSDVIEIMFKITVVNVTHIRIVKDLNFILLHRQFITVTVNGFQMQFIYSDEAQRLVGQNYYRPSNPEILKEFGKVFDLNIKLVNIDDDFGGGTKATEKFFADGTIFDQIYKK